MSEAFYISLMYCATALLAVWSVAGVAFYAVRKLRKLTLDGGKRGHFNGEWE